MGGGKGSSSKVEYIVGYKYWVGMHMIVCHGPVTAIRQINADDYIAWTGNATESTQISIDAPNLFVGPAEVESFDTELWKDPDEHRENVYSSDDDVNYAQSDGGIVGDVDIEFGDQDQGRNSYLLEKLGEQALSAFRGVLGFVLRQVYIGNSPYIKPWSFLISNFELTDDWYPEKKKIFSKDTTIEQSHEQLGVVAILKVVIHPQEAIDAGAMWRICETTTERYLVTYETNTHYATRIVIGDPISDWKESGEQIEFGEAQDIFIEYKDISDTSEYRKPSDKKVTIKEAQYLVEGYYKTSEEIEEEIEEEEDQYPPQHER